MNLLALFGILAALSPLASADIHVGPQLGFYFYHRNAPEETDSTRISGALSVKADSPERWLIGEFAVSYETGLDTFATQDMINDRIFRIRAGGIFKPFRFDSPVAGIRTGLQYNLVRGVYDTRNPISTDTLHPAYWSPYFGLVLGVFPDGGFGVETEFTFWYDQYFKAAVFQMNFGLDVL